MSDAIQVNDLGPEILGALGLPPNTRDVSIHFMAGEVVLVRAEVVVTYEQMIGVLTVIRAHEPDHTGVRTWSGDALHLPQRARRGVRVSYAR